MSTMMMMILHQNTTKRTRTSETNEWDIVVLLRLLFSAALCMLTNACVFFSFAPSRFPSIFRELKIVFRVPINPINILKIVLFCPICLFEVSYISLF